MFRASGSGISARRHGHLLLAIDCLLPGKARDREVRILIDTWTSRNLDEPIPVKVASDVLGVRAPGGWKQ